MAHPPRSHVTGALVLGVAGLLFVLATPMCDTTVGDNYATEDQRRAYVDEVGPVVAAPVLAAAWVNRAGRAGLVRRLGVLEEPFRTHQYWKLYPVWGEGYRTLEVAVDGRVVHATNDPDRDWMAPQLRERRIGYSIDAGFKGNGEMLGPLAGWLVDRARADFPDASEVTLTWREGPYPGDYAVPVVVVRASAPGFAIEVEGW